MNICPLLPCFLPFPFLSQTRPADLAVKQQRRYPLGNPCGDSDALGRASCWPCSRDTLMLEARSFPAAWRSLGPIGCR